jgi:hypothetical protein
MEAGAENYPEMSLQAARARANQMADQAKHGVNPKELLKESATAGSFTFLTLHRHRRTRRRRAK